MSKIRLYVLEEQDLLRNAYKAFFPAEPTLELVGITDVESAEATVATLALLKAEVFLLGTKMLRADVVERLHMIRDNYKDLGIVLLSATYDVKGLKLLREFAKGGTRGTAFLLKHSIDSFRQLTQVVQATAEGRVILDHALMEGLMDAGGAKAALLKDLTSREMEVLNWMSKGYRNTVIAEILTVDPKTVERHINSIYSKVNQEDSSMHPRVRAIMTYLQATGLMPVGDPGG